MDSMDLPSNQQTTIRDYLKPGSIVVFAIIVIIISSHSSNAHKTFIASNKKPVLSHLEICFLKPFYPQYRCFHGHFKSGFNTS
ncbi:hypothetical protein BB389_07205 [Helicobacter pylori]|nr:hypothetical protein BB389_07205 [Helicobacter pylori]